MFIAYVVDYALNLMKRAWRNGTAPTCTAEVPDFVEKHVHDNYVLTAGVKRLPVHKHLLHVDKPTILHKPPHMVHKVLKGGGGGGGPTSSSSSSSQTTRRARDRISNHPYKHVAAAIASARRSTDDPDDDGAEEGGGSRHLPSSSPSLFGVAGVIGGPEFDSYQMYRHGIFPFKEQLAHEVNKLVLEKKTLDALRKRAAAADASRQQQRRGGEDNTTESGGGSSYDDDGSDTDTLIGDDEDDDCMLSSSSTLIDEDDVDDIDDEITD